MRIFEHASMFVLTAFAACSLVAQGGIRETGLTWDQMRKFAAVFDTVNARHAELQRVRADMKRKLPVWWSDEVLNEQVKRQESADLTSVIYPYFNACYSKVDGDALMMLIATPKGSHYYSHSMWPMEKIRTAGAKTNEVSEYTQSFDMGVPLTVLTDLPEDDRKFVAKHLSGQTGAEHVQCMYLKRRAMTESIEKAYRNIQLQVIAEHKAELLRAKEDYERSHLQVANR